jgi:hypothetical protein
MSLGDYKAERPYLYLLAMSVFSFAQANPILLNSGTPESGV